MKIWYCNGVNRQHRRMVQILPIQLHFRCWYLQQATLCDVAIPVDLTRPILHDVAGLADTAACRNKAAGGHQVVGSPNGYNMFEKTCLVVLLSLNTIRLDDYDYVSIMSFQET